MLCIQSHKICYDHIWLTIAVLCIMLMCTDETYAAFDTAAKKPLDPNIERILKKTHHKSYFEKNIGQWEQTILAHSKTRNLEARFFDDKISFSIKSDDNKDVFVYNMKLNDISHNSKLIFVNKKKGVKNHLGCVDDIPTFEEVRYVGLYPNIDLRFYTNLKGKMEFDYIVYPGGDPSQISYKLLGVEELEHNDDGYINYCSPFGLLQTGKTYTYQEIKGVEKVIQSDYEICASDIGFSIQDYDVEAPLIIDPTVFEWSTYIGGSGFNGTTESELFLGDNCLYLCGFDRLSDGIFDYPTTPGSFPLPANGLGREIVVSKFDTTGNLIFSTYLAMENEIPKIARFEFDEQNVFFGTFLSGDASFLPGISGNAFDTDLGVNSSQNLENIIGRLDENGQLIWSTYLGGDGFDILYNISVVDGIVTVGGYTTSTDFPLYQANNISLTNSADYFISKFDYDGNIIYSSYLDKPGAVTDLSNRVITSNGYTALVSTVNGLINYPISQNPAPPLYNDTRIAITVYDPNNNEIYSTLYNNEKIQFLEVEFEDNQLCILTRQFGELGFTTPGAYRPSATADENSNHVYCIDVLASHVSYASYLGPAMSEPQGFIELDDNNLYFGALINNTNITSADVKRELILQKFDVGGNLSYEKFYGVSGDNLVGFEVKNESSLFYVNANVEGNIFFPSSDAAQLFPLNNTSSSAYILRTDNNGNSVYGTWISGQQDTKLIDVATDGEIIYFLGYTTTGFPTTVDAFQTEFFPSNSNRGDYIVGKINTAPCIDAFTPENTIGPNYVEVCMNGTVPFITGSDVLIDQDSLPQYLINGVLTPADNNFIIEYQWQINFEGTPNWIDIAGATSVSHQPSPLNDNANFRRILIMSYGNCDLRDTSNISLVDVNSFEAPQLPDAAVFYKCATSSISLNVTATGGTEPLSYQWTPSTGLSDPFSPTPVSNASVSTIYDVEVTDANGCIYIEQYTVRVYDADAGSERVNCIGTGVQIGTPHVAPGVPGFRYFWTPVNGLSNANIAQPVASPTTSTVYTLTIFGPDNCLVSDDVEVNPVQTIADAGADMTYCFDGAIQIGEPADPDYTFVWTPGQYLDNQQLSNPTVSPTEMPSPNPLTYTLTKIHNQTGCSDTDTVQVFVNRAEAGIDFCGPRTIGAPDHSNGLATFTWTVLSGDNASIIGQENIPQPFVSPNVPTTYQLQVEWNGNVCTDTVFLPTCGCLLPVADAYSDLNCPVGSIEYNTVIRAVSVDTSRYNYLWSPTTGIPDPTSPFSQTFTETLTSPVDYTITATLKTNSSVSCATSVTIYPPPTPFPFAHAVDGITCPGEPINIGGPNIPGWTPVWSPDNGDINQINIFNPTASPTQTSTYIITLEENASECQIKDTAIIEVYEIIADAGVDDFFCENSVVMLGTAAIPGLVYSWEPSEGLTNSDSAQPIDTLFASTTYYLTVSDSAGICQAYDTLVYTVVNNPIANAGDNITVCAGGQGSQIGTPDVQGNIYLWTPSTGLSDPNVAQPFASPSSTTIYSLTVSNNANGCFSTDAVTVDVESTEMVDAGPDIVGCVGDEVQLGLTTMQAGYVYLWEPSTGLSSADIPQPIATINDTITYTLTLTAPSGCMVQDQTTVMPSTPEVDAGEDFMTCMNTLVTLGTPALPGYTYAWTPNIGLSNPNIAQPTWTAVTDMTYTVTATDPNNCSVSDDVTILVQSMTADAGPDQTICDSPVQIGVAGSNPNYRYSWSPSGSLSSPSSPSPFVSPSIMTVYTLTITDLVSGCQATDQVTVTPSAIANAGPDERVCLGEEVQIGPTPSPGCIYQWSPTVGLSNPNIANPFVNITTTRSYTLQVTKGACTSLDMMTVFVSPNPEVTLSTYEVVCQNECIEIGPQAQAGYRYTWSPPDFLSDPNIANPIACPNNTITYSLEVTDLTSGCSIVENVNVDVSADFVLMPNAGLDKEICPSESTIIGFQNQNPTYNYAWSPSTYLSNPFLPQTAVNIPLDAPGEYTYILTATHSTTGCQGRDTVIVTLFPEPSVPVIPDETICSQTMYTLCANCITDSNLSYSWSPSNEVSNPDSLTTTVSPFNTATYTLSVIDLTTNCETSESVTIFVTDDIAPNADAGPDRQICIDESITIGSSDAGFVYEWFPVEHRTLLSDWQTSNPTFTPNDLGEYTFWIDVINAEGCIGSDTVHISVLEDAVFDAGTSFFTCSSEVMLNASITGAEGIWTVFSGPSTPTIIDPVSPTSLVTDLLPGTYKFAWRVNSENVCNFGDLDLVTVEVQTPPELSISAECETINNQVQFTYSFSATASGLTGTYNISGFETHSNLSYNQTYGPFGPFPLTQSSYELVLQNTDNDCEDNTQLILPGCIEFDFGDLPDTNMGTSMGNYNTLTESDGPRHATNSALLLGNIVDTEPQALESSDALGDGEDEDAFKLIHLLEAIKGITYNIPFYTVNTTGQTAYLKIWIDWNGDGDFEDLDEAWIDIQDNGFGNYSQDYLTMEIPLHAVLGKVGFRARLSHDNNLSPYGQASIGEVEDYLLEITENTDICLPLIITIE